MRSHLVILSLLALHVAACASSQSKTPLTSTSSESTNTSTKELESAHSSPELTPEAIHKIVRSHFGELQSCYESTLANDNSLAGIVELELTIARDGTIKEGRLLKDNLGSAELNLCLVKKMIEWEFPAHASEALTIEFPFAFSPKR